MSHIKTERVFLRKFKDSDFVALKELLSDDDIVKMTGFRKSQTDLEIQKHLETITEGDQLPLGIWAAVSHIEHDLIGWFMLKDVGDEHPELGFMINKKFWKMGYATEISKGIINYAFMSLGLKKVVAKCDLENSGSKKVLERSGMKLVKETEDTCNYEISSCNY